MPAVYSAALPGSQCLQDIQAFQVCLKNKTKKRPVKNSLHKTYQLKIELSSAQYFQKCTQTNKSVHTFKSV